MVIPLTAILELTSNIAVVALTLFRQHRLFNTLLCAPDRIRRLTIPVQIWNEYYETLPCVEYLNLTSSPLINNAVAVVGVRMVPRLRQLYVNSNICPIILGLTIDYVSVYGTYKGGHGKLIRIDTTGTSSIARMSVNVSNLDRYRVSIPHTNITTATAIDVNFAITSYTYVKITSPQKVTLYTHDPIHIDCLILDAPEVKMMGDITFNELYVQSHLWWQFCMYKPRLLSSKRGCVIT